MTHHTDAERAKFEAVASDCGEYPRAIERDAKGNYLLQTTAHGWMWWQAARRAPAEPVISEAQVLAITTAYEQGVGKGHQSHAHKETIANPYGDEWGCDSAWQMGYGEGREQAESKAAAPAVPQGWKLVQIELLERIQESLGSFLSDQGWSQSDMDTADALGGLLAAAPQPPACNLSLQPIQPRPAIKKELSNEHRTNHRSN